MPFSLNLLLWSTLLGLYLLLTGQPSWSEAAAGSAAATLAFVLVRRLRRRFTAELSMKAAWLPLLLHIPAAMLTESWLLLVALCRQLRGRGKEGHFMEHPLPPQAKDAGLARSAFMVFGVCITPNSYLVYEDSEKNLVLVRQLVGKNLSTVDRLFVELP